MEVGTTDFSKMAKHKDAEDLFIRKVTSTRVNGTTTKSMAMASSKPIKEVGMKAYGKTANNTDMEKKIGQMVQHTRDSTRME